MTMDQTGSLLFALFMNSIHNFIKKNQEVIERTIHSIIYKVVDIILRVVRQMTHGCHCENGRDGFQLQCLFLFSAYEAPHKESSQLLTG